MIRLFSFLKAFNLQQRTLSSVAKKIQGAKSANPDRDIALLLHTPSSYYSMIARFALLQANLPFKYVQLDIHRKHEQFDDEYIKLNPSMTVPTLVLPDGHVLDDSRLILRHAFPSFKLKNSNESAWIERHYLIPIEDLTMCWLVSWNPLARHVFPQTLANLRQTLMNQAASLKGSDPELSGVYERRAEVFYKRMHTLNPATATSVFEERWKLVNSFLNDLDQSLNSSLYICGDEVSAADICAAVLLARVRCIGRGKHIDQLPALRAYETRLHGLPAYQQADIWSFLNPLRLFAQTLK